MLTRSTAILLTALLILVGFGTTQAQTTNVWPGDINNNGAVNHVDLLYLGLNLGEKGTPRDSTSINWVGHSANLWRPSVTNIPDPCYADCIGDSMVEQNDRIAIDVNFGLDRGFILPDSSSLNRTGGSTAPLEFDFSTAPLVSGGTDTIYILLGTPDDPVDSLLGFATTITFDSTVVDSAYLITDGSWLGTEGVDLMAIDNYESGELDIAMSRTDTTDIIDGHGRVAGVVIAMIDDLKREVQIDTMGFQFADALGMNKSFGIAGFEVTQVSAKVFSTTYPLDALIYPVPTTDGLNIAFLNTPEDVVEGTLYDFGGRLVREFTITTPDYQIARNGLRSGIYYLQLRSGESWLRKRIVFAD